MIVSFSTAERYFSKISVKSHQIKKDFKPSFRKPDKYRTEICTTTEKLKRSFLWGILTDFSLST